MADPDDTDGDGVVEDVIHDAVDAAVDSVQRFLADQFLHARRTRIGRKPIDGALDLPKRRFWFYGAEYTLEAQMQFLKRLRRVTEDELDRFTAGKELPANVGKARPEAEPIREKGTEKSRSRFCILDHVGKTRIVGKNHVTRCPSCAQAGRDRGGDNLAVLVADPRFYLCWAGCTKEMIRAAVGKPIPVRTTA